MQTNIGNTTTFFVGNYYQVENGVITKYYYAGSQRVAMRKNGNLNFIIGDHLGSTSIVTDASGNVTSQQKYKAWGEVRYESGTNPSEYSYTGQYSYTDDFGLMYYGARWYDSSLSRFAQADSIIPSGVQGYERYAYTFNNPIRYTDPTGHVPVDCYGTSYCGFTNSNLLSNGNRVTNNTSSEPASGVIVFCGSQGGGNMNAQGPECLGSTLDAWDPFKYGYPQYNWGNNFITYPPNNGVGKWLQFQFAVDKNLEQSGAPILICYSAGSEACLMYAVDRIEKNLPTKSIVLLDPTFTGSNQGFLVETTFEDWKVYMDKILNGGTSILVIDDNGSSPGLIDINQNARDYSKPEGASGYYLYEYLPFLHNGEIAYGNNPSSTTNLSTNLAGASYNWAENPWGQ